MEAYRPNNKAYVSQLNLTGGGCGCLRQMKASTELNGRTNMPVIIAHRCNRCGHLLKADRKMKLMILKYCVQIHRNHTKDNLRFHKHRIPGIHWISEKNQKSQSLLQSEHLIDAKGIAHQNSHPTQSMANNYDLEYFLDSLLSLFSSSSCFYLKPKVKIKVPAAMSDNLNTNLITSKKFMSMSKSELFRSSVDSKQRSLELQEHLAICTSGDVKILSERLISKLPDLMVHKYGNYVAQRLALRDVGFANCAANFCLFHLEKTLNNEFASRVLQTLSELNTSFRKELITTLIDNPHIALSSNPAVHAVCACLRAAHPGEPLFILEWLNKNKNLLWNKGYQKVLSTCSLYCSDKQLDEIFAATELAHNLKHVIHIKLLSHLVINMVFRGHESTMRLLSASLRRYPQQVMPSTCFRQLIVKAWQDPDSKACTYIADTMTSIDTRHIGQPWTADLAASCFYMYVAIKSLVVSESNMLAAFLERRDIAIHVKKMQKLIEKRALPLFK